MKVQELLDCEDKWTKGAYARNENEKVVISDSMGAVKWCLFGAILKCYPSKEDEIASNVKSRIGMDIEFFNDSRSYEQVIEVVRRLDI